MKTPFPSQNQQAPLPNYKRSSVSHKIELEETLENMKTIVNYENTYKLVPEIKDDYE